MKHITVIVFGMLLLFCISSSFAQTYYIKVGDIKGESTERAHKDWIICEKFSQGLEQAQLASGAARQRRSVVLNDLIITKKLDKATPMLMEICAKGQTLPQVELHMVANGNIKYKLTLNNVRISGINTSTICEPDCKLVDEVAFSYSQITWVYLDNTGKEISTLYNAQTGN